MSELPASQIAACDEGIRFAVRVLDAAGVETYQSCQGGDGHCSHEPFVHFYGGPHEGFRAFTQLMNYGLRVKQMNRFWSVSDGELTGPQWEITFRETYPERADETPNFIAKWIAQ